MGLAEFGLPSLGRNPPIASPSIVDDVDLHAQSYAERTGGDFFDTVRVGSRLAFLLTDIAGRRPDVDPIVAEMQRAFRATSTDLFSAATVNLMEAAETLILGVNHALIASAKGVRFAPTMIGCYDAQLGILAYINAGGQTALFRDSEGTRSLPNASVPLGLFTHMTYDASIQAFEPGAMLLVVTKGVTESMANNTSLAAQKVIEVLQASKCELASDVCNAVLKAASQPEKRPSTWMPFRGKPTREDMTVLAMVRTG